MDDSLGLALLVELVEAPASMRYIVIERGLVA
jgi:hypothetical protein